MPACLQSDRRSFLLRLAAPLLPWLAAPLARAHQVPALTVEAEFDGNGGAAFQVNLDPRLFLAEDPTTLPPVPAAWFRDMPELERERTLAEARTYVRSALTFFFGDQKAGDLEWQFDPIDGATGEAFDDSTAEVHFLAKTRTRCPQGATTSVIRLETDAKAAAVLLNSLQQQAERRPQILFPGETSRAFRCIAE